MSTSAGKTVAIVGAGPSGLAAAKYLLAEKAFARIDIFEQRNHVGGVWNYTPAAQKKHLDVPQTNPNQPLEEPTWLPARRNGFVGQSEHREPVFTTPLYDSLETNIPSILMQYSDKPFPPTSQLFPTRETVAEYLREYAAEIRHMISFQTQVLDVRLQEDAKEADLWRVTIKDLPSGLVVTETYGAVVAASGHYTVPFIPSISGITAWSEAYPDSVIHSKFYRNPDRYHGKKVAVVGNSASGIDICAQIGPVCQQPLLASQRSESYLSHGPAPWKKEFPQIEEFLSPNTHNRAVRFADGRVEEGIDIVVFATGYFYSFPFLSSLQPQIIEDGSRTLHMYKHFLYIEHPTLAVPALNQKIIPFPVAENQAAVFARVWSGRLSLPSKEEMYAWEESLVEERGVGKDFHVLGFPQDADYINELHDWSMEASEKEGLENGGKGKEGPGWGAKERWTRERFPAIKKAFGERGEGRRSVRTLEELGYDFEAWKVEQEQQGLSRRLL